ncbi:MAG: HlyD family efflux transporter periplasmic adaptor subunit [Proteobacteria bacterium]|nr:HlyD family efflux transporter periplasmic adaptor subunit [Pseudomonadota bacterium]
MTVTASREPQRIPSALPTREADAAGSQSPAAVALLQLLAELRKPATRAELAYFIANETRAALRAQQIVVFAPGLGSDFTVQAVSSLAAVDRSSPLVQWFDSLPKALAAEEQLGKIREFDATALAGDFVGVVAAYPLRNLLWVPWVGRGGVIAGGMVLARTPPWTEHDHKIASYLGGAFAHAWSALGRPMGSTALARMMKPRAAAVVAGLALCLLALPVPMTALAPVEIAPRETSVVTTGVEGIVASVEVEPNATVKSGQLVVTLNDTNLRNRAEIAEREVLVADTKYKKAAQLAFVDARGRHEMAIARSELDLKLAERNYARELLARTQIRAGRDGVAFFADKKDLIGKPVSIGEKLMEIADPQSSEFRIELPVGDAIVLHENARVKVFLDSDPLNPIEARLVRSSYKAAPREAQQFAFRLVAEAASREAAGRLRLGMRGTAQIYSDRVPLGFYLFRRPIAAARQWSGL